MATDMSKGSTPPVDRRAHEEGAGTALLRADDTVTNIGGLPDSTRQRSLFGRCS